MNSQPKGQQWIRRTLWFSAWLVWLPLTGYGIAAPNLLLGLVGGPTLFVVSLYFSLRLQTCSECGKKFRVVGAEMSNCMSCGGSLLD